MKLAQEKLEELKVLNILLVEDEEAIRIAFSNILKRLFKTIFLASNGIEGIEIFNNHHIDLIITDIRMPKMHGFEMAKRIKEINSNIPIIIVSVFETIEYLHEALDIGIDGFLVKPVKRSKLQELLIKICDPILKNRELNKKNKQIKELSDKREDIVIETNGQKMISANKAFFDFFKDFNTIDGFHEKYKCIIDIFEKVDKYGYVYQNVYGQNWIEFVLGGWSRVFEKQRDIFKVKINRDKKYYIFEIKIKKVEENLYLIYLVDITRIESYKEELEKVMYHQSRFAQMGEMINMIAHQWRQPLNIITLTTTNIKTKIELNKISIEQISEKLDNIEIQAKEMSSTINNFMDFAKPNRDKEKFKLIEVLKYIQNMISAQFEHREIKLIINIDENLEFIGYEHDLEQVLLTIIANARDAFEEENLSKIEDRKVIVSAKKVDNKLSIFIEDNAGGIPSNIIDKIFDPYFTTKDKTKGTGLGLYMSKSIIQKSFNGNVEVENVIKDNELVGARFSIFCECK